MAHCPGNIVGGNSSSNSAAPEPVWLQDSSTQTCLGPQGKFTPDCGDATLWLPVRQRLQQPPQERKRFKRKRARMGLWGADEEDHVVQRVEHPSEGWVFYLVDRDVEEILHMTIQAPRGVWWNPKQWFAKAPASKRKKSKTTPLECLVHHGNGQVSVGPCDHKIHRIPEVAALPSWGWTIDTRDDSMQPTVVKTPSLSSRQRSVSEQDDSTMCAVVQEPTHEIQLATCAPAQSGEEEDSSSPASTSVGQESSSQQQQHQVELSMVRYRAVSVPEATQHSLEIEQKEKQSTSVTGASLQSTEENSEAGEPEQNTETEASQSAPVTTSASTTIRDLAHKSAFASSMHPGLALPPRLLFEQRRSSVDQANGSKGGSVGKKPLVSGLHNTNPILLAGVGSGKGHKEKTQSSLAQALEGQRTGGSGGRGEDHSASLHHRKRRIPVHPYIAAAKDEKWIDPQTGLQYHTDLSGYLGHDRKERGRHTLMGVGQYRKGYVIKVYGIAYYVSKRDVLADPFFEQYAEMSTQELQRRTEFYEHLRLHPENFERTMFIQTNMQLSAETIRGSLKADWTMLTDEAKDTILESSMKPQDMDERTKEILDDPNNPGRCSCMSMAPPEFNADPTCCARGTELVFTWLKNGDIECRLNGRIVEVFPRPDIAQGIFFEYLRYDDPISPELKEHVVDGFPFLLAPLAQVKGVRIGQTPAPTPNNKRASSGENPILRVFSDFADSVGSHAAGVAGSVQRAASDSASNMQRAAGESVRALGDSARALGDTARNFGDSVQDLGREMNRRRDDLAKRAASIPDGFAKLRKDPIHTFKDWVAKAQGHDQTSAALSTIEAEEDENSPKLSSSGRLFGYPLSRWFGDVYYAPAPDEIGPMIIHPTMDMTRKIFLLLVHLYLLLLFIVSFPGSYTTRTKLIRKTHNFGASKVRIGLSDTESDTEDEEATEDEVEKENPVNVLPRCIQPKSYFSPRYVRGVALSSNSSSNKLRE
eukprot:CAMPEP_0172455356 /NCGR_PEP_ID=MMETSP1065-20121228/12022_1 /TAXON_ID=265537 /ORGANISM="Amphiprora paludosa, Strain CCMP125" /LENGTH=986 /DNA_ID=CAMNT_0013207817 /DNA_START=600 /DNA_END=3561 /DNA_ORIENTATION=-